MSVKYREDELTGNGAWQTEFTFEYLSNRACRMCGCFDTVR